MSSTLTPAALDSKSKTNVVPSLVLEIDGYPNVFTISTLQKYTRVGDVGLYVDGNWVIGETLSDKVDARNYISMDGTSNAINQQLQQDKGGATSVTSLQISLIDYNQDITRLISPSVELTDILGREAFVYLGFADNAFPEDYIVLFVGIIDEVTAGGNIVLNIANPEQKKRQEIFISVETELTASIDNSVTTIPVLDTSNFLLPVTDIFTTYVKIDDEIIRYTGKTSTTLTGCTRAQFDTIAVAHDDEASAASWYRLQGQPTDLALQIMLSGPEEYYREDITVSNFVRSASGTDTANSLFFAGVDVVKKHGLTVGDYITTTGASNGANNFTLRQISLIEVTLDGSVVTVDGAALVLEIVTAALAKFKSQHNILPDGLEMGSHQVDVDEFNRVQTLFSSSLPEYDFYLTSSMSGKEFIDKELLYPANLFTLPKRGRVSLGFVSPPLAVADLVALTADNLTDPDKIKSTRSVGKYFYNTVVYKYNYDAVETDKALTGYILVDEDSKTQIPVGTKAIKIESKGFRNNAETGAILSINARRLLSKYKIAAEIFKVSGFYGDTFNIDVGDVVLFGDESMPLVDSKFGVRGLKPRLCEVVDKRMDIKSGKVDLTIVDTSYLIDGRYGIFSPSSIIGTGSTTSAIVITDSYGTAAPEIEKSKWIPYIGMNLLIRNIDWSTTYDSTLLGFDPSDPYTMLISTIGGAPTAGMIVDIAQYPSSTNADLNRVYKNVFVFSDPSVDVTAGVSDTEFTIGAGDVSKFLVGAQIMLHNEDWSVTSPEVRVAEINGSNIVVNTGLGFTPTSVFNVELIGFKDGGNAYRYL